MSVGSVVHACGNDEEPSCFMCLGTSRLHYMPDMGVLFVCFLSPPDDAACAAHKVTVSDERHGCCVCDV